MWRLVPQAWVGSCVLLRRLQETRWSNPLNLLSISQQTSGQPTYKKRMANALRTISRPWPLRYNLRLSRRQIILSPQVLEDLDSSGEDATASIRNISDGHRSSRQFVHAELWTPRPPCVWLLVQETLGTLPPLQCWPVSTSVQRYSLGSSRRQSTDGAVLWCRVLR